MKRFSLRVRVTALVVGVSALAVLFVAGIGGVSSVDSDIAATTLGSTAEALNETDLQMADYVENLQLRIEDWTAQADDGDHFTEWDDDLPGLRVSVLDEEGTRRLTELDPAASISPSHRCRASNGNIDCGPASPFEESVPRWASRLMEQRLNEVPPEVPVVLYGFVVEGENGEQRMVQLETDIFAANEVEISSGIEDLALVVLPLLLVLLGGITWFSLGRALSPVEFMTSQVDQIGAENLDQRVPVPEADDEIQHLAETMNRMLDRLQYASESQRQFISDASHELRSPITATGATLEVARSNPDNADWEQVASVVEEENNRLASLVDDLLLLARLDEEHPPNGTTNGAWAVDLEELCLTEAHRPHPVDVHVRVVSPARVMGNQNTLARVIRNLVDNAAAHAETSVLIEIDGSGQDSIGGMATVRILDDGPGVPPHLADQIFERFVRVDESRVRNGTGGAGLGLAIARRIAEGHGGTVELDGSSATGACFVLRLPVADHASLG